MTIDEIINAFQYFRNNPTTDDKGVIKAGQELFDTAIDIMRKYKQIEQILDDCDLEAWEVLGKVKEVVTWTDRQQ